MVFDPIRDKANREVTKVLTEYFGVAQADVKNLVWLSSPIKVFEMPSEVIQQQVVIGIWQRAYF